MTHYLLRIRFLSHPLNLILNFKGLFDSWEYRGNQRTDNSEMIQRKGWLCPKGLRIRLFYQRIKTVEV